MISRRFDIRVPALCLLTLCAPWAVQAQGGGQGKPPEPPPRPPRVVTPSTGQERPTLPPKGKPKVPDYPDPRTLTIGAFYWYSVPGTGPSIRGGQQAAAYSSLYDIGKYKPGLMAEVSYPVTRTGDLKFEGSLTKGTGNQIASVDTAPFSSQFTKGDYLSSQYQIETGKLYLDDLLYPYKFPVSKLRFKSILGVRYLVIKNTIDVPLNTNETTATGSRQVIDPALGAAMEYAVAPHVLFRVEGSGFGIPGRAYMWDGAVTVSYRHKSLEFEGGYKALGFKTSPVKDEYEYALINGGFVGVKYHWK